MNMDSLSEATTGRHYGRMNSAMMRIAMKISIVDSLVVGFITTHEIHATKEHKERTHEYGFSLSN